MERALYSARHRVPTGTTIFGAAATARADPAPATAEALGLRYIARVLLGIDGGLRCGELLGLQ